jgi:hypothetical protein
VPGEPGMPHELNDQVYYLEEWGYSLCSDPCWCLLSHQFSDSKRRTMTAILYVRTEMRMIAAPNHHTVLIAKEKKKQRIVAA